MDDRIEHIEIDPNILLDNIADAANIIPISMSEPQLKNLQNSINAVGQTDPVIVYDGKLYDGRRRCIACARNSIKVKIAIYDNEAYTEDQILNIIAAKEDQNKNLNIAQKAINALENYVIRLGCSVVKASKMINVSDKDITAAKYIKEHPYAVAYDFYNTLKNREAVKLPVSGKYSISPKTIRRELEKYDEIKADEENGEISTIANESMIDYDLAFAEFDYRNIVKDLFWETKNDLDINTYDLSCILIYKLLKAVYHDKYDFETELTLDKIKRICKI